MENIENLEPSKQLKIPAYVAGIWDKTTSRHDAWVVFAISVCAILPAWLNYDIIARDGAHLYVPVAKMFLNGEFQEAVFSPLRPLVLPLYEFLVFLMAKVTGFGLETSGRLVSVISFLFAAVGIYKVADILFHDRAVSFLSVVMLLANRELITCSVDCLKESLLVALVIWGNYFMLKGISSDAKLRYFIAGCAMFVVGGLVRSTSLIFLIAWGMLWVFHKKQGVLVRLLVFLFPLVAIVVVYHLNSRYHWGLPFFRRSYGLHKLTRVNPDALVLMKHSLNMIRQFLAKWYYVMALFGFLGVYWLRKEAYTKIFLVIFIIFFLVCTITSYFFIDRYIIAPVMAIYPIAAYAVARSFRSGNTYGKILSCITIAFCVFLWADKAFTPPSPGKLARKEAGLWILSQMGPEKPLLTNRPRIGFYADTTPYVLSRFKNLEKKNQIIARKTPYWVKDKVVMSKLKGGKGLTMAVALDLGDESQEVKLLAEKLASWKLKPDKTFRDIQVYLPGS
ncbi:MAG: hypothetical protein WAP09_06735 [Desulfomonilia bacterium]